MVYPGAGIAVSNGSAWVTSLTDNSANWNTVLNRVLYTDTSAMLTNYKHWGQGYLKAADIVGKLNISDTSSMLTNYRHWAAGYTKNSDTSAMLSNYRHWLQGYIKSTDTAAMLANYQTQIFQRVKYSDTAAMLSPYVNGTDTIGMRTKVFGNYGNIPLNRFAVLTTPANDSLTYKSDSLKVKGIIYATGMGVFKSLTVKSKTK